MLDIFRSGSKYLSPFTDIERNNSLQCVKLAESQHN